MTILILALAVLAVWTAWRLIRGRLDRELAMAREQEDRLRVQREQYAAERRVQALAQRAFDQLLEEARSANGGIMPGTTHEQPVQRSG
jgi:argininosuccinate lyase